MKYEERKKKKKKEESFSLYQRKNYHDPLSSVFVVNFLNVSRTYEQPCIIKLGGEMKEAFNSK